MIGKMMILDPPAFRQFFEIKHSKLLSQLIVFGLGLAYGAAGIAANAGFIASFEGDLLRNVLVPLIFLFFGLLSAWITKIGLTVLLWAGARGFGGPGRMAHVYRAASVALIPGILALPLLTGMNVNWLTILAMIFGVAWMFLICVRIHEATQGFGGWKAYAAVFAAFVFFASIYYLVMPTGAL
ncbi:hypothetical protein CR205_18625 [Alteribacter lacisalsi]|uniref:Yip1 domain-containing protein n=1 Tax=Alteribacter lacisalsi TaxID=2045244 RepID=A0A2W0H4K9_9BACI|nr:YIP1 family protein [Alteribacter lacisalsi]PYZ95546.1 hypothetical protein CR205_18625 [Alteribacter lacisalsi]